jgi:hypothetical protein
VDNTLDTSQDMSQDDLESTQYFDSTQNGEESDMESTRELQIYVMGVNNGKPVGEKRRCRSYPNINSQ